MINLKPLTRSFTSRTHDLSHITPSVIPVLAKAGNSGTQEIICTKNPGSRILKKSNPLLTQRIRFSKFRDDANGVWIHPFLPLFILIFLATTLSAEKSPLPRFVSLKSNEINQRVGPGPTYPVEWTYVKAGLPVEITAEFDNWRKIRDKDGTEGWVHQSMVCGKRHGIVQGTDAVVYASSDLKSQPIARLEPGVMVEILKCRDDWCQIRIANYKGWVQSSRLWGVYPQEVIG